MINEKRWKSQGVRNEERSRKGTLTTLTGAGVMRELNVCRIQNQATEGRKIACHQI